jgi:hypothetical protein
MAAAVALGGSGVVSAGLDSMHAPWDAALRYSIDSGGVALVLSDGAAPPPESRIPAGSQRAARRFRRFRVDQSGRRRRGEAGFAAGECQ